MHRSSMQSRWPSASVAVALVVLTACSSEPDEDTEVAGVVLERGSVGHGAPEGPPDEVGEPDEGDGQAPAGPDDGVPLGLHLLRSGPVSIGTVWLSAAGEWVGLDGQILEPEDVAAPVHLHAIVETDGDQARLLGCEVRIVAPEDAELQGQGRFTVETVVEHVSGEVTRSPLDPVEVEVTLAPGEVLLLDADAATDQAIELDADRDRQVRCEGRFDRT